jgi:hypothetical protein
VASRFRNIRYLAGASVRRIRQGGIRGLEEVWQAALSERELPPLSSIGVWPPVQTGAELADLSARLGWYVPDTCSIDIPAVDVDLEPDPVPWFRDADQKVPDHATVIASTATSEGYDAVLVWRHEPRTASDRGATPKTASLLKVDPGYRGITEPSNYARVSRAATDSAIVETLHARSGDTYAEMLAKFTGASRVAVFGTGPSRRDVTPKTLDADLVIACNSAVRDAKWIEEWKPQLIVFADPVFHFGPSRYAEEFRTDLRAAVDIADSYVVIPDEYGPLLERHMPDLGDRLIGLEAVRTGEFLAPSLSRLAVARTSNVLTYLMLPLAAALGEEIAIAGCDGRDPNDDYFWRHDKHAQYTDELMKAAMEAHPAYFRDRDYARYYQEHCGLLAKQLDAIEGRGTKVTSVTTSHIPALRKRVVLPASR